jgi:hypothetical protein
MEEHSSQVISSGGVETLSTEDWWIVDRRPPESQDNLVQLDLPLVVSQPSVPADPPSVSLHSTWFSRAKRLLGPRIWLFFLVLKLVGLSTSVWLFLNGVPFVTIFLSILLPIGLLGVACIVAFVLASTFVAENSTTWRQNNRSASTRWRSFRLGSSRRNMLPLYESPFILASGNSTSRIIDWSELGVNSRRLRRFLEGLSEGTIQSLPTYIFSSTSGTNNRSKEKKTSADVHQEKEKCIEETFDLVQASSAPWDSDSHDFLSSEDNFAVNVDSKQAQEDELSGDNLSCAICLEPFRNGECLRILPCFHQFHIDCIDPWLKRKGRCAVCKNYVQEIFWNPM